MTETLKPCPNPWCNPTMSPITISERDAKGKFTLLAKRCFQCGVQSPSETTLDKAITAWNTRAPDDVAQIVAWQPIETWPGTDQAYALVCRAGNVVPFVACYDENGDEWTSWNGHYERGGKQLIPTHWMPLPAPPEALPPLPGDGI